MKVRGIVVTVLLAWHASAVFAASHAGDEFQVNTYTSYEQSFPSVCGSGNGNFVVVWESGMLVPQGDEGSLLGIVGQRFASNGSPSGGEFVVNTYTTDYQSFPRVACANNGRFVIVWTSYEQDGDNNGVFGQRFNNAGEREGTEFQVNSHTTGQQDYTSVASDASGNFVVVWASAGQDGNNFGVFGQRFDSNGGRLGSEFRANTFTTGAQDYPSISATDSGAFVVAWSSEGQDGSDRGIFAQRYDNAGAPLGAEFRVNSYTSMVQDYPSVATDPTGNFVVVWVSTNQDGNAEGIFGQRYAANGNTAGPEFQVNTYTTGLQVSPDVATDNAGDFVVSWTSRGQDGDEDGIFAQRFASTGAKIGTEFRVNTSTTGYQYAAAVAAPVHGQFVVVWASVQDANFPDVFGQRYADPTSTPTHTSTRTQVPPTQVSPTAVPTVTRTRTATRIITSTRIPTAPDTATASPTAEPTSTSPPTATDTAIPPTETPPPPPTATATSPPARPGDCNGDGSVAINELVQGVSILLGTLDPTRCPALDRDQNGQVSINELVAAVNELLAG